MPIAASLDLHANVTHAMLERADAMVAYRTYPHVDMAETGARTARLLDRMLRTGSPLAGGFRTLDYLTGIPSQCSLVDPCRRIYSSIEANSDVVLSFTPGFPMADIDGCGMAVFGYGSDEKEVRAAVEKLRAMVVDSEKDFALELHSPDEAVVRAKQRPMARSAPALRGST